jgi:hypothetical protein
MTIVVNTKANISLFPWMSIPPASVAFKKSTMAFHAAHGQPNDKELTYFIGFGFGLPILTTQRHNPDVA